MSYRLDPDLLLSAYWQGFFPMPNKGNTGVDWYSPDPRAILPLCEFHASRSLKKRRSRGRYRLSINKDFPAVMRGCADREDTWISAEFFRDYLILHQLGFAHSIEVWNVDVLVGGLYGVSFGGVFCAESMFHKETDASKLALWYLVEYMKERRMSLLEVQFLTPHLESLGAIEISREDYLKKLQIYREDKVGFVQTII